MRFKTRTLLPLLGSIGLFSFVLASPNDTYTTDNPATGKTQSVWSAAPLGGGKQIFTSTLAGPDWQPSKQLTSDSHPSLNPHMGFMANGDRQVAYWNDEPVDTVYLVSESGGAFGAPVAFSDGLTDARYPSVAVHQGETFVAWEGVPATGSRLVWVGKSLDPGNIYRELVATTSNGGDLAIETHREAGRLWITWIDSGTHLGWSEYAGGSWSAVSVEAYSGPSDIGPGRGRIRGRVLAP